MQRLKSVKNISPDEAEIDLKCPHCEAPYCIDGDLKGLNTVACSQCGRLMYLGDRKVLPGPCPSGSDNGDQS